MVWADRPDKSIQPVRSPIGSPATTVARPPRRCDAPLNQSRLRELCWTRLWRMVLPKRGRTARIPAEPPFLNVELDRHHPLRALGGSDVTPARPSGVAEVERLLGGRCHLSVTGTLEG